jgi:hypothetical protein
MDLSTMDLSTRVPQLCTSQGLNALLLLPAKAPAPRIAKVVSHWPETSPHRASTAQSARSRRLSQEESMTADSPMIVACYEAYLDMRQMLSVFAELRGDDPQDALW